MPPTDSTPSLNTESFELVHSLKAYDKIPVYEYKSKKSGLTVVVAEVDGPVVNGHFCLATETFDDDGIPHTLEHLIFLGSENYPYKGVLDLLANRCLASGTNAWTDTDHTCYTMETASSEGFLALLPIYLDHILYPLLSEEGYITEVHHVTEGGEDAGVVYCEMQGRENSGESRVHLNMQRAIYPGRCGYSSETGGIMKNLRESITNQKIKDFHKDFYRPENLKLIITGKINHDELFQSLEPMEQKIVSKGERGVFNRPWQSEVPPLLESQNLTINYPSDEEDNGIFVVAWRGPSAVREIYELSACSVLLRYLTESSVSLLQKEFVEIDDPYANEVYSDKIENSSSCLYLNFCNVPLEKLPEIKPKLDEVLNKIVQNEDIDMKRMKVIIKRQKLESLSQMESYPHNILACIIIEHMLYGNTKQDYEQRLNPLTDLDRMSTENSSFWLKLLQKYFVNNNYVAIEASPSIEEKNKSNQDEKNRVKEQIEKLGPEGLRKMGEMLSKAVEFNERKPPQSMLTCVPIPNTNNINYHEIIRHSTRGGDGTMIDLKNTPIFTYFDHVKTSFVYIHALMDSSKLSKEQRLYLPLLLEALLECPIMRDGTLIPYEEVINQLNDDTLYHEQVIGLEYSGRFACSSFSNTVKLVLQVEVDNYVKGVKWLRELLYQTVFTSDRIKIIATKIVNDVAEAKRSGRKVASYILKSLYYIEDSNVQANGIIKQQKFLQDLIVKLDKDDYECSQVLETMDTVRKIITDPSNVSLYLAANLEQLKEKTDPVKVLDTILPIDVPKPLNKSLNIIPDWKLLVPHDEGILKQCVVGMGCLESSFFLQSAPSINTYDDPDMPALLLYAQYLVQTEGPLWRQVRGKGLSYGYTINLAVNQGLLHLLFSKSTNVVDAYKEAREIVMNQLCGKEWDENLLATARSSLIYEHIETEATIVDLINNSLYFYFYQVDYNYNRKLLDLINKVTIEDLNRVGDKYIKALFDQTKAKTALVCDSGKAYEISEGFKKLKVGLQVFPSLEESFLNTI